MAGKVGSARQITDKRNNCIIAIVLKHPVVMTTSLDTYNTDSQKDG